MKRSLSPSDRHRALDEYDGTVQFDVGSASPARGDEHPSRGNLAGHLLIPDVDERRGWREWYVYHDPPTVQRHRTGFGKP